MLHERHSPSDACDPRTANRTPSVRLPCFLLSTKLLIGLCYRAPNLTGLPVNLKNLYTQMTRTTEGVTPNAFLQALRQAFPQFAEMSRAGAMKGLRAAYAQQGLFLPPVCLYNS